MKKKITKKVSIGLPVYNGERYLAQSLESLLAQTFQDFELIIIDNSSTDSTEEISQSYVAKDERVQYHRNETNIGLSNNFNRAFLLSSGTYFKWAAADDLCNPRLLECCTEVLDKNPDTVLAYPQTIFINGDGEALNYSPSNWSNQSDSAFDRLKYTITTRDRVTAFDGLVRSTALRKTSLFPEYFGGDYFLLSELALLGKFQEVPEPLFFRRIHPENSFNFRYSSCWFPDHTDFRTWRLWKDYISLLIHIDATPIEKIHLALFASKRLYWQKAQLFAEFMIYLRSRKSPIRSHDS